MTTQQVPLEALSESPLNHREFWGDIPALAESLKVTGLLQPIRARRTTPSFGGERYEIVFGHRRARAARLLGWETIETILEPDTITDAQVVEKQATENLERKDVHPLEESLAFERLTDQGWTLDKIAAQYGRSRAHIVNRLKLRQLSKKVREAFVEDRLQGVVAMYIARIPDHALQEDALRILETKKGQEPAGARYALDLIERTYMLRLDDAAFDRKDKTLVPEAGPCSSCPKRTGNQRDLFADVKRGDLCIDPKCYGSKVEAHKVRRLEVLKAEGVEIVKPAKGYGGAAVTPEDFVPVSIHLPAGSEKTYADVLPKLKGDLAEIKPSVMFDSRGKEVHLLTREDARKIDRVIRPKPEKDMKDEAAKKKARESRKKLEFVRDVATDRVLDGISASADASFRLIGFHLGCSAAQMKRTKRDLARGVLEQLLSADTDDLVLLQGLKDLSLSVDALVEEQSKAKEAKEKKPTKVSASPKKKGAKK